MDLGQIIEAALMCAGRPLPMADIRKLFDPEAIPATSDIVRALDELMHTYADKSVQLVETASGFRFQAAPRMSTWMQRLQLEKPAKYSPAFMETLAIIAYRQPITRGEIEDIRGVAVSSKIIQNLLERDWVAVLGTKEIAGRPALYGTTRVFLDDFGLSSLEGLPTINLDTKKEVTAD
jgi:segregation and condensation protein B